VDRNYRETTIRVCGEERVIRTEQGKRTQQQLGNAHTRAVRNALKDMQTEKAPGYRARVQAMNRVDVIAELARHMDYYEAQKLVSRNEGAAGTKVLRERLVTLFERRSFSTASSNWDDARKGAPRVKYTETLPENLLDIHEHVEA
jgi:hypothetical protein